ncbi:hypothetical protein [Dactylosporangium sp. NPDC005555]|uniref:hypothetical protein n=1 Tax=Dactylosporangium sp. NPDC005555 TaxID=3154889 RepID=UPI0033B10529
MGKDQRTETALRSLLRRDEMFTERVKAQVQQLKLPFVEVNGGLSEDGLVIAVAAGFGLRMLNNH